MVSKNNSREEKLEELYSELNEEQHRLIGSMIEHAYVMKNKKA